MKFSTILFALAICAALLATANVAIILVIAVAVLGLYKFIEMFGADKPPVKPPNELRKSSDKYNYIER